MRNEWIVFCNPIEIWYSIWFDYHEVWIKFIMTHIWPIPNPKCTMFLVFFFSIEFRFHRFLLVLVSYPQQIEAPWWHVLWYFMFVWVHQLDTFLQEFIRALVAKNGSLTCFWLLCFVQGKLKADMIWNVLLALGLPIIPLKIKKNLGYK